VELSKLGSEIRNKDNEIATFKTETLKEKNKNEDLRRSIQNLEENYQLKIKKL
jgi:predicted RNase H-like nuclease (RuvC/YqgF family)